MKKVNINEYLKTDSVIVEGQEYFVLSYILPDSKKNEISKPLFKFRGAFSSLEECQKHVEKLKVNDLHTNIYVCKSFEWGQLIPDDELLDPKYNVEYRNNEINDLLKGYYDSREKAQKNFETRKKLLQTKAKFENTEEGKEWLNKRENNKYLTSVNLKTVKESIKEIEERLQELREKENHYNVNLIGVSEEEILEEKEKLDSEDILTMDEEKLLDFYKNKLAGN